MIREIEQKPIRYEEYWVLRGVSVDDMNYGKKSVKYEEEFSIPPTEQEIVDFLVKNKGVAFVSVEHNFRLV